MSLCRFWWSGITSTTPPVVPVLMQSGTCLSPVSWHWWVTTLSAWPGHEMWVSCGSVFYFYFLILTLITNSHVLTLLSSSVFPQLHFEVPLSPVIAAKKARPSDGGSDEVCGECMICWNVGILNWIESLRDIARLWERMDCTAFNLEQTHEKGNASLVSKQDKCSKLTQPPWKVKLLEK